jgi:hypothetical protein
MGTFFSNGVSFLERRLSEIDLIVNESKRHCNSNVELYNVLCRSAHILLLAHFEGYTKQLVKDCLDDINSCSSFRKSKRPLKKKVCENFAGNNDLKIRELMDVFELLETKFRHEYFLFTDYKNPKASVLDKIVANFGIENFFKKVKQSKLDLVFSNTDDDNILLRDEFRDKLKTWTSEFPYQIDFEYLEIDQNKDTQDNLWEDFLNDILMKRHAIAHGSSMDNSISHSEIETNKVKVEILIYVMAMFICHQCNPVE